MELKQRDINFDSFHYTIEKTGIRLIKNKITTSSDVFVEFENIGSKIVREKSGKRLWLVISVICFALAIFLFVLRLEGSRHIANDAEPFYLTFGIIFLIVFLVTRKNRIYLVKPNNKGAIEFVYKARVDEFIKILLQKRNDYLVSKYATFDKALPYPQQYNNLVWLYNSEILTKEQFDGKISELKNLEVSGQPETSSRVKIQGFKSNNKTE